MNDETLDKANRIKSEMACIEKMLTGIEHEAAVDITFNNDGRCCGSYKSDYLSDEEVIDIRKNITELIRKRAQMRLADLEKEFNNL